MCPKDITADAAIDGYGIIGVDPVGKYAQPSFAVSNCVIDESQAMIIMIPLGIQSKSKGPPVITHAGTVRLETQDRVTECPVRPKLITSAERTNRLVYGKSQGTCEINILIPNKIPR